MYELKLPELVSVHCCTAVREAVYEIDQSAEVEVDLERKVARITSSVPRMRFVIALVEAGYMLPEPGHS